MSTPKEGKKIIPVGRSINEIVDDLSREIPERFLRTRKQSNATLTYIPWHEATKLLDYYAPGWTYMVELLHIAGKVVAIATISIPTDSGHVSRQATGNEDDDKDSFGDPFSNSESMALRRAAAKFGLGRYLYK
jgi:hypothetical protein